MKPAENTIGLECMGRGMVAEAADASRVIKVGEIELFGVSGNRMGVFGESWLWCGCVVVVVLRDKSVLHNGRLHDKETLCPGRAYRPHPCRPLMQKTSVLDDVPRYPSTQVTKYPSVLHASVAKLRERAWGIAHLPSHYG